MKQRHGVKSTRGCQGGKNMHCFHSNDAIYPQTEGRNCSWSGKQICADKKLLFYWSNSPLCEPITVKSCNRNPRWVYLVGNPYPRICKCCFGQFRYMSKKVMAQFGMFVSLRMALVISLYTPHTGVFPIWCSQLQVHNHKSSPAVSRGTLIASWQRPGNSTWCFYTIPESLHVELLVIGLKWNTRKTGHQGFE